MPSFPETSLTLLQKLAVDATGGDEAAWVRFFSLYTPAIRRFVAWHDRVHDPDDIVQDIYLKLVGLLRQGRYDPGRARFRTFLAMLIRHQLVSLYRKEEARGGAKFVSLDALAEAEDVDVDRLFADLSVPAGQADEIDRSWARAKHQAAVEHVLNRTALSPQSKAVYQALALEGRSVEDVAKTFGIAANMVYTIKFRVEKRIQVVEEEFAESDGS